MKYAITNRNHFGNGLFGDLDDFFFAPLAAAESMKTDIREKDGNFVLDVDLPGYDKKDISLEVENGYLTVRAEKQEDKEEKDKNGKFLRRERSFGSVSRSFYVGDVREEDVKAAYNAGTLTVTIPAENQRKPEEKKRILIE